MGLSPNAELLKDTLEALPKLGDRYSNLRLVNYDSATGVKRGCFSLVFKAHDDIEDKTVAIKFFDPACLGDIYRMTAFKREHEILQQLVGAERCLQLVGRLESYPLTYDISGKPLTLQCEYFAVDWIEDEIDDYFLSGHKYTTLEKVRLLFDVLLAVEALHARGVFHRDIKADNLRSFQKAIRKLVIAIDFGTAARFDSRALSATYSNQVGAPAYAAPEAICGLAGNRIIAPFNDDYAVGCLLYELFNPDYFFRAVRNLNVNYDFRLSAMRTELLTTTNAGDRSQADAWNAALAKFSGGTTAVPINGIGSFVEKGAAGILNELLASLTHIDYRNRLVGTGWARRKLLSAIKLLENEAEYQKRLASSRERRRRRIEAAAAKARRLDDHLGEQNGNP